MYTKKLEQIVELQDQFNKSVNPNWINADYDFCTAIFVESAELIDSFNWKWWKKGEDNLLNAKVEVVDIFHFLISEILQQTKCDKNELATSLNQTLSMMFFNSLDNHQMHSIINMIQMLSYDLIECKGTVKKYNTMRTNKKTPLSPMSVYVNSFHYFSKLVKVLFDSPDELINMYFAKNILNKLRQENGYKTGQYIKIWNKVEDNMYVMDFVIKNPDLTFEELYTQLDNYYKGNVNVH